VTARGWTSKGLPTVGDDPTLWTVTEAAALLGPPELSVDQVRALVRLIGLEPVGKRAGVTVIYTPSSGRYARVYPAQALIEAYEKLHQVQGQP
jgi:hypothetical protein